MSSQDKGLGGKLECEMGKLFCKHGPCRTCDNKKNAKNGDWCTEYVSRPEWLDDDLPYNQASEDAHAAMRELEEIVEKDSKLKKGMDNLRQAFLIKGCSTPKMFLTVGLPRSGKSTWVEKNKSYFDAVVLENDWIRANILHAPHHKSNDPAVWMIVDASARILLSQGRNVIIDGIHLTRFARKFFIDMAKECGAIVVVVAFDTDLKTCIKRNKVDRKLPNHVLTELDRRKDKIMAYEYDEIIYAEGKGNKQ